MNEKYKKPSNIYEHLELMRPRVEMYIGKKSLKKLQTHLEGYTGGLYVNNIEEEGAPPFDYFKWWLAKLAPASFCCGWADAILEHCGDDEDSAFDLFFKLADEYSQFTPEPGQQIELPPSQTRAKEYSQLNGEDPVPNRIQLIHLKPGDWTIVRHWYGNEPRDKGLFTHISIAARSIELEFAINPEIWIKPSAEANRPPYLKVPDVWLAVENDLEMAAVEVAKHLGVDHHQIFATGAGWIHFYPKMIDLNLFADVYRTKKLTDWGKYVLGCFIVKALEEYLESKDDPNMAKALLDMLYEDIEIHQNGFESWALIHPDSGGENPEGWWNITKYIREYITT